jgi:hypothetical protein
MDLYPVMEYLTTAACCAAALAVVAPFADRPPPGRPGGIGDPRTLARICAVLALLFGLPAFAIGDRLFGLAAVLATLRFMGPVALVAGAVAIGPLLLLEYSQRLEKQRERSRRATEEAANHAVASYRYDARQFRTSFLPCAAIVGGGSLYYATLLWENVKRLRPEGPLMTKLEYVAASLLFMVVFWVCCKLLYLLLFRLPSIVNASGFLITEKAFIQRAGGFGKDHWVPWESIQSIHSPRRPSGPYEIRHHRGVLRVPAYVLEREPLIAAILERSPHVVRPSLYAPDRGEAIPGANLPGRGPEMWHPLPRVVGIGVLFLISDAILWIHPPLPGAVQVADVSVSLVAGLLLTCGRPDLKNVRPAFLYDLAKFVVLGLMFNFCFVTHRALHW